MQNGVQIIVLCTLFIISVPQNGIAAQVSQKVLFESMLAETVVYAFWVLLKCFSKLCANLPLVVLGARFPASLTVQPQVCCELCTALT